MAICESLLHKMWRHGILFLHENLIFAKFSPAKVSCYMLHCLFGWTEQIEYLIHFSVELIGRVVVVELALGKGCQERVRTGS